MTKVIDKILGTVRTVAQCGLAIAKGDVAGHSVVNKFGHAPDFDIADGDVTVWDGADDGGLNAMQYTYSTSDDIDSISSSDNGDTQDMEIQGLDINYNIVIQTVTLTGQTRAALTTNLIRVFRMKNVNSTDISGTVYCYVNGAITLGVPDDKTKVRAMVLNGHNQTLMAVYTVPAGKTAYMTGWYAGISGAKKTSVHVIHLVARKFGQVFQLKHVSSLVASGTSHVHHNYSEPLVYTEKTDIEMHTDTDTDVSAVSAGFDLILVDN